MTSYRIFRTNTGTDIAGPSSATSFGGGIILGLGFRTTARAWLEGFWWWVASGQATTAKFALWQTTSGGGTPNGTLVSGVAVTSGTLTAGWNYTALPAPVPLTPGVTYRAAAGLTGNFPFTGNYFSTGGAGVAGLTGRDTGGATGPLFAFSDMTANGGTAADPWNNFQGSTNTGGSDPAAFFPNGQGSPVGFNGWVDVQITNTPPASASYSLWPSLPTPMNQGAGSPDVVTPTTDGYTMALQFSLSAACKLNRIRFFSNTGATVLPARCAIWDAATQTVVAGTDNAAPAWKKESDGTAASAAAGWVYCDYSGAGVTLAAGRNYKAAVWSGTAAGFWRTATNPYWATSGDGAAGLTSGPITAPNAAGATPGQNSWNGPNLAWAYPNTYVNPENDWIDIQVTPVASGSGLLMASFP